MRPDEPCDAAGTAVDDAGSVSVHDAGLRVTYYLFLGMGLATLLPWNLFISASEFYSYQFSGSPHQHTFQNWFSVVYMVSNFASNAYAMATVGRSNPHTRILGGQLANTAAYVVGIALPFLRGARGSVSFYIALAQLAVTAASSGMMTNSLFALVVHFPSSHSEGLLSGQAVAGVMATAAQLLVAYSVAPAGNIDRTTGPPQPAGGLVARTVAYFAFATVVSVLLTAAFWRVSHNPYYQQRTKHTCLPYEPLPPSSDDASEYSVSPTPPAATVAEADPGAFADTFRQVSGYAYAVILTFAVTLSMFPSVTALVRSVSGFRLLTEWHFFVYNLGDFAGRRMAPSIPITRVSSLVLIGLLRILLIPAFFACHLSYSVWYNAIQSDWAFLVLVVLLSSSNGLLSTRCAMTAPGLSSRPTIAGTIIGISISSGLALGSLLSWPVRSAGCLCLPF